MLANVYVSWVIDGLPTNSTEYLDMSTLKNVSMPAIRMSGDPGSQLLANEANMVATVNKKSRLTIMVRYVPFTNHKPFANIVRQYTSDWALQFEPCLVPIRYSSMLHSI